MRKHSCFTMSNTPQYPDGPVIIDLTEETEAPLKRPALPLVSETDGAALKRCRGKNSDEQAVAPYKDDDRKFCRRDLTPPPLTETQSSTSTDDDPFIYLSSNGNDDGVLTTNIFHEFSKRGGRMFAGKVASNLIHFEQKDNWSCGYRNMQMLLSALLPLLSEDHMYFQQHATHESIVGSAYAVPSILDLQRFLEESWREGFDPSGARHYGYVAQGTKSQIGAVEVSNAFTYLGIDSTVIQFIKCPESRSKLPLFCSEYFDAAKNCCCKHVSSMANSQARATMLLHQSAREATDNKDSHTSRCSCSPLPLYLQWVGHSVTIVGVEKDNAGKVANFLIFDPKQNGEVLRKKMDQGDIQPLRLPCRKLATRDCQIVMCCPRSLDLQERTSRKQVIKSVTAAPDAVLRTLNNQDVY